MGFSRRDLAPVVAIAVGTLAGVAVTTAFVSRAAYDIEVNVHRDLLDAVVVESVTETVRVRPGTQAVLRLRDDAGRLHIRGGPPSASSGGIQPLVYVDGIRIQRSEMEDLDPDAIDRIEIVKGGAAEDLFGPQATGGVIQIFLKATAGGSGGN